MVSFGSQASVNIVITDLVSCCISFLRSTKLKTVSISLQQYYFPKPLLLQVAQWLVAQILLAQTKFLLVLG